VGGGGFVEIRGKKTAAARTSSKEGGSVLTEKRKTKKQDTEEGFYSGINQGEKTAEEVGKHRKGQGKKGNILIVNNS